MIRTILAAILLAVSVAAGAQTLTPAQLATLRADVLANADTLALYNAGNRSALSAAYNAPANPSCIVWRTKVTLLEYVSTTSPTATTFSYSGAGGLIARSQGELVSFIVMFLNPEQAVNPALPNVRAAFSDIFSGAGVAAVNNRAHMASMSKRTATRGEKVFASGACSDAAPSVMTFEGLLSEAVFVEI